MALVVRTVALDARPLKVATLCFEVGGIVSESMTKLGAKVTALDLPRFLKDMRAEITDRTRDRMRNGDELETMFSPGVLVKLRADAQRVTLNKAVNERASAFYTRYEDAFPNIISRTADLYGPGGLKATKLQALIKNTQSQTDQLAAAYAASAADKPPLQRTGVVKATTSVLDVKVTSSTILDNTGEFANRTEHQEIQNTDYGYRVPHLENLARNDRAQISLLEEEFALSRQDNLHKNGGFRLDQVLTNELESIGYDVHWLQIAYLNTMLFSPISGVVTGLYKEPGDAVSPGEPVIRVENNDDILLVGTIVCRGEVFVGGNLEVKTNLFGLPGSPRSGVYNIVAARCLLEDDHWEVVAQGRNVDPDGKTIYPLRYHFNYDNINTKITVFGPNEI